MKKSMSYNEQIKQAKQVMDGWTVERKSWMQAQGTNEYAERRALDSEQKNRSAAINSQKK